MLKKKKKRKVIGLVDWISGKSGRVEGLGEEI